MKQRVDEDRTTLWLVLTHPRHITTPPLMSLAALVTAGGRQMATPELDLQGLWETTLREVALEGSNGCTLERLWKLVGLVGPGGPAGEKEGVSGQAAQNDPQEFVKGWLWR